MSDTTLPSTIDLAAVLPRHRLHYYGGAWQPPQSGRYFELASPGTGESLGRAADGDARDVEIGRPADLDLDGAEVSETLEDRRNFGGIHGRQGCVGANVRPEQWPFGVRRSSSPRLLDCTCQPRCRFGVVVFREGRELAPTGWAVDQHRFSNRQPAESCSQRQLDHAEFREQLRCAGQAHETNLSAEL